MNFFARGAIFMDISVPPVLKRTPLWKDLPGMVKDNLFHRLQQPQAVKTSR
jgi:hypothetical protein